MDVAQASVRNVGTCPPMRRENSKRRTRKDESTDAECRGGIARSSEKAPKREWSEGAVLSSFGQLSTEREEPMDKTKPYEISKQAVLEAFRRVKANKGSAGSDNESMGMFEANLKNNLYKLWNRMSSGSYFPPPVKAVEIPKKAGGVRVLGVPTVADRVAQMVVRIHFEPKVEPLPDRPGRPPGEITGVKRITRR